MRIMNRVFIVTIAITSLPAFVHAENWINFHTEKWSRTSEKLSRKLNFANSYFYDAASMVRTAPGDMTLWIKEVSENDRYYVKKGAPKSESVFRKVHVWCTLKRYEVLQADSGEEGANELLSEEIKAGSYYEMLHKAVCTPS